MMGSGSQIVEEAVNHLVAQGQKVGLVKVGGRRGFGGNQRPHTGHHASSTLVPPSPLGSPVPPLVRGAPDGRHPRHGLAHLRVGPHQGEKTLCPHFAFDTHCA